MPPFKKSENIEDVIAARKEQIEHLKQQCYAVEVMLGINSDQQYRIRVESEGLARNVAQTAMKIEEVEQSLDSQVKYMAGLSKSTEEHLKNRFLSLQKSMEDVEKDNAELRRKLEALTTRREADLQRWIHDVEEKEQQIEDKALNFGLRLKETLLKVDIH